MDDERREAVHTFDLSHRDRPWQRRTAHARLEVTLCRTPEDPISQRARLCKYQAKSMTSAGAKLALKARGGRLAHPPWSAIRSRSMAI